ncbi:MAG: TylF/MycF/NovP-related O-methyltransferase [Candidatus Auribacterota bacterium]
MNQSVIDQLLDSYPLITDMLHKHQLRFILEQLEITLQKNVEGDVVELGCNEGTTSLFIRRLLDYYKSDKKLYVYDSFQGLPSVTTYDISKTERQFTAGGCKTEKEKLMANFAEAKLDFPIINEGWFKEIPDHRYPDTISFAFFDGDFYSSIMDSFEKVYHKLSPNAIVCIHDFGWEVLPGVEQACQDFLSDKSETVTKAVGTAIGKLVKV